MAGVAETPLSTGVSAPDGPNPKDRPRSLQDTFLDHVRTNNVPLSIFLVNGVKLQGVLAGFDTFSLLLKRGVEAQIIYKHVISTILPMAPIRLYEPEDMSEDKFALIPRPPVIQIRPRR